MGLTIIASLELMYAFSVASISLLLSHLYDCATRYPMLLHLRMTIALHTVCVCVCACVCVRPCAFVRVCLREAETNLQCRLFLCRRCMD